MTPTDIAAIFVAFAVPLVAWVFSRITKARQAETHESINHATESMRTEVIDHMDQRLGITDQRLGDLARSVQSIDARESETREKLAELRGRFDQAHGAPPIQPPPVHG